VRPKRLQMIDEDRKVLAEMSVGPGWVVPLVREDRDGVVTAYDGTGWTFSHRRGGSRRVSHEDVERAYRLGWRTVQATPID
jgi:hypothetical protein